MKKAIYYAGIVAMMLASCAKEQAEPDSVRNGNEQEIQGTVVTIQAALGSQEAQAAQGSAQKSAATKTTQTGGSYSWSDDETISVGTSAGSYTTFDLADATAGTFTHTFDGDAPDLQMAVSPAQSDSYIGPNNFTVSLPTVYDGYVSGTTNALLIGTPDPETENKFLFHHAAALIKVTYNNVPYGTTGLVLEANQNIASTSGITLGSTDDVIESDNAALNSSTVQINLASDVSEANQTLVFYVPVPVGEYTGLNIYLVNSSGKIDRSEKTATKSFTLARKTIFATPGIPVDITIDPVTVGNVGNTDGFEAAKSQDFTIAAGKRLNLVFDNYSSGTQVYYNWVLRNTAGSNTLHVRADNYATYNKAWGGCDGTYSSTGICQNANISKLNGATVTASIDYYSTGNIVVNVSAVKGAESGTLRYSYTFPSPTSSITSCLVDDHSHFVMKDAWIEDAPVLDSELESISFSNAPSEVYIGQLLKNTGIVVTAHFADGTSKDVTQDATITSNVYPYPESFSETGTYKYCDISYNKTKLGNTTTEKKLTAAFYVSVVAAPPVSIAVTTAPRVTTYYYTDDGPSSIAFRPGGMVVTSTDSAGGTATVSSGLTYSAITKEEGPQDVTITYTSGSIELTTTQSITLVKGTGVGLADYSTPFNTYFSSEKNVPSSSSVTFTFDVYSASPLAENFHCPVVVLDTDTDQYARADDYSWPGSPTKSNNWNNDWWTFRANMNNSRYVVTVTNKGNGYADIRMDITWANGTTRYQTYTNVPVNSTDLYAKITCQNCYLVMMPE